MGRIQLLVLVAFVAVGCINSRSESGVANVWRSPDLPTFEVGKTTRSEVVAALGPPSQLITLDDGVVFYYLAQSRHTQGMILLVYNQTRERVSYDRAIYFFDAQGVLEDYALSVEQAKYQAPRSNVDE